MFIHSEFFSVSVHLRTTRRDFGFWHGLLRTSPLLCYIRLLNLLRMSELETTEPYSILVMIFSIFEVLCPF